MKIVKLLHAGIRGEDFPYEYERLEIHTLVEAGREAPGVELR